MRVSGEVERINKESSRKMAWLEKVSHSRADVLMSMREFEEAKRQAMIAGCTPGEISGAVALVNAWHVK